MISSVFKTKKLVFVRKGTLFMTAKTEAIKAQILSTGNAEILLEENDFLIVKWIKPEIKYSMAAYQYGKTGMANNYPWECSLTEEQIAFFWNISMQLSSILNQNIIISILRLKKSPTRILFLLMSME